MNNTENWGNCTNEVCHLIGQHLRLQVSGKLIPYFPHDRIRGSSPSSCGSSPLNITSTPPPDTSSPGSKKVRTSFTDRLLIVVSNTLRWCLQNNMWCWILKLLGWRSLTAGQSILVSKIPIPLSLMCRDQWLLAITAFEIHLLFVFCSFFNIKKQLQRTALLTSLDHPETLSAPHTGECKNCYSLSTQCANES